MLLRSGLLKVTAMVISILVLIGSLCLLLSTKKSETAVVTATKIAVLDSARLKSEATCFRGHRELEEKLYQIINKMRSSEAEAKKKYEDVKNNKSLTQKQRAQAITDIETKWDIASQDYKKEIEEIKTIDYELSNLLQKKLDKVLNDVASKYKIDIILNTQIRETVSVFYSKNNVDITDIVVKRLNDLIPHVDLGKLK